MEWVAEQTWGGGEEEVVVVVVVVAAPEVVDEARLDLDFFGFAEGLAGAEPLSLSPSSLSGSRYFFTFAARLGWDTSCGEGEREERRG